jgi:hypothetical protein
MRYHPANLRKAGVLRRHAGLKPTALHPRRPVGVLLRPQVPSEGHYSPPSVSAERHTKLRQVQLLNEIVAPWPDR